MKHTLKFLLLSAACSAFVACSSQSDDSTATDLTTDTIASTTDESTMDTSNTPSGFTGEQHIWLEDVTGERALETVKAWNADSASKMETSTYKNMKAELLEVYNSPEKIPYASYRNGRVHNFWQDDIHVRGIWRTTSLDSYTSAETDWETVLDIDAVAKDEDKNWVYKGNSCLAPEYTTCIVNLSIGGKDAVERREFDTQTKSFVEGGFFMPESKGSTAWVNADHLLVGVDFGEGSMTESGYPLEARLWTRGTDITDARPVMRGAVSDVGVWPGTFENADGDNEIMIARATTFYDTEYYWVPMTDDGPGEPVQVSVPTKSSLLGQFKGQQLVRLQEDWRGFKSGALVSYAIADFMDSGEISDVIEVVAPNARQSIDGVSTTKSKVLIGMTEDVAGAAYAYDFVDGAWTSEALDLPENGAIDIVSTNSKEDVAFMSAESFLTPETLFMVDTGAMQIEAVKSLPDWFDAEAMVAEQKFAESTDGTRVPYFIIHAKDMEMTGDNPTLLYGYGGFEISLNPSYSATIGRAWLEKGGVYVVANTRGGGEYGPAWHQAGLKTERQKIYDDFIAVAEDLISTGVTQPANLGIHGRSNGGLLMGVMFTQRPDLFNAVAIGVPLLDMRRYHLLLAGASWVGEYGDPEDEGAEGAFIRTLSPYHQIEAGTDYPVPYIYTSTKDDRVHPGHARKFAMRLEELGYPFYYYENIDGGHAGAANLEETAHSQALIYSYFASQLMPQ